MCGSGYDGSPSLRRRRRLVSSRRRRRRRRSVRLFMSADPVRLCCRVGASSIVFMTGSAASAQDQSNHGVTAAPRRFLSASAPRQASLN